MKRTRCSSSTGRLGGTAASTGFVTNKVNCWSLYLLAKTWQCRPSELLGLESGSYQAYTFDEAIAFYGNNLKHRLEEIEAPKKHKNPQKYVEQKRKLLLHKEFSGTVGGPKFKDPGLLFEKMDEERQRREEADAGDV